MARPEVSIRQLCRFGVALQRTIEPPQVLLLNQAGLSKLHGSFIKFALLQAADAHAVHSRRQEQLCFPRVLRCLAMDYFLEAPFCFLQIVSLDVLLAFSQLCCSRAYCWRVLKHPQEIMRQKSLFLAECSEIYVLIAA